MKLVIFLSGLRVWLGSQLNSARHNRCGVINPQTRVVSTDEVSLRIPDTQSLIADEFKQDNVDIKQSPEVADVRVSLVQSGNLQDSVWNRSPGRGQPEETRFLSSQLEDHCQGNCW